MASAHTDIHRILDEAQDLAQAVILGRDQQSSDPAKLAKAILILVALMRLTLEATDN